MSTTKQVSHPELGWLCYLAIGLGAAIHVGTALLRLRSFFPSPVLVDFSAFYASAAALRQGISPYGLPASWLASLQANMQLPGQPPAIFNPPLWPWLLQPLAMLPYPTTVWVWLLVNLGLLAWVASILGRSMPAEIRNFPAVRRASSVRPSPSILSLSLQSLILFAVMVTFGPVFLDLSIGQTSVMLLAMCALIGLLLRREGSRVSAPAMGVALSISAVAKLYPVAWLVPLALMRRWKALAVSLLLLITAFGSGFLLLPEANRVYWQQQLPRRLASAADQVSMDDQSLVAWLDRLVRPHTYNVPGLETRDRAQIVWSPMWSLDPFWVKIVGFGLCAVLGAPILYALIRADKTQREGAFYLWVLYILVIFPHMERYNHALLLPGMVWLWQRNRCTIPAAVYFLAALSRLNHLWISLLPAPFAPLASGFGLFAVLLLIWGMLVEFKRPSLAAGVP
jgi:hypothetical protein